MDVLDFDLYFSFKGIGKFQSATIKLSSRYSHSCFSGTTGLISVTEALMESFPLLSEHLMRKTFILILASASAWSENPEKCY